jgi:hypothetical protein
VIPTLEEAIVAIHLDLLNRLDDMKKQAIDDQPGGENE